METQVMLIIFFFAFIVVFLAIFKSVIMWAIGTEALVKTQKQSIEILEKIAFNQAIQQEKDPAELDKLFDEYKESLNPKKRKKK